MYVFLFIRRASMLRVLPLLFLTWFLFVQIGAQQRLVIVGGGTRPKTAMSTFIEWAGGAKARILIIPWATSEPESSYDYLKKDLVAFNPQTIDLAPIAPMTVEKKEKFLNQLKSATGVFFTGGDQVKIMEVLKDRSLMQSLQQKYTSGAVFGGTSAGTAIMSHKMITGEGDFTVIDGTKVETVEGLGLLPNDVIVDQHFIKRQRQNRLFGLLLQGGREFGIGIDEDTAVLIRDNRYGEVIGGRQVMTIDPQRDGSLVVRLVRPGEAIDLRTRKTSINKTKSK
jgi:cyanophycinase